MKEICLKVTKQSGTVHYMPLINQKALVAKNAHMGIHDFKIEKVEIEKEFDEETATHYITSEKVIAVISESKNIAMKESVVNSRNENKALLDKIAELEKQIKGSNVNVTSDNEEVYRTETALEVIARVNASDSINEVEEVLATDERNSVIKAAKKRLEFLQLK